MFDTITRSDEPEAASHAANTSKTIGIMLARVRCVFRIVIVTITDYDDIIPARHSSDDIMWDRYISRPAKEIVNARNIFM